MFQYRGHRQLIISLGAVSLPFAWRLCFHVILTQLFFHDIPKH